MPSFNYRAVDQSGRTTQGQMDALNDIDLEIRLERIALSLISFKISKASNQMFRTKKVSLKDLMMFCFQLEQLTSAGVPLLEGLADLRDTTSNLEFQKIIGALVSDIEGGKMLSEALTSHPQVFSKVFLSLVGAGEKTGQLPEVFDHLAATFKWQDELVSQTKRLIVYPLFVLLVVISAVVFLMIYLVPQMVSFLNNLGQTLPMQTRILISISNAFVNYWWLIISLPILPAIALAAIVKKSDRARYQWESIKLGMPITGPILQKIILARFARYFALMYQSGIPVLDAIKTCEEIAGNLVIAQALQRAQFQINAGDSMSDSFQNTGIFPPLVVRMLRVGESAGALDQSLLKISYFYDRDVHESIEAMLKLLEPALTVVLGSILAFIMLSVLGPIYDSFSQLKI